MGERVLRSHREHHRGPFEGGVTYPEKLRQRAPLVLLVAAVLVGAAGPQLGAPLAGRQSCPTRDQARNSPSGSGVSSSNHTRMGFSPS